MRIVQAGGAGSLPRFFALTYLVAWTFFLGSAALAGGAAPRPGSPAGLVFLLGVFAPGLVALGLTARAQGRPGVGVLLGRILKADVGPRWYAFAVGYLAAIKLAVALVHRLATGSWPRFGSESWYLLAGAILISTWFQAGEEIGWRGYALPRLAARFGLGWASLLLGVIWAAWHLPLFFLRGGDTYQQSFPVYLLQVTALSVALTWLYVRTNGSLLLTMLMHAAINNTKDIVPSAVPGAAPGVLTVGSSLVGWLTLAFLWAGAGYFLVRLREPWPVPGEPSRPEPWPPP